MKNKRINKIGIITFHNAINYGAVLQTYALQHYLNNNKYLCETINYQCKKINNNYKALNTKSLNIKKVIISIVKLPSFIRKHHYFDSFIKNNIKLSPQRYNSNNISDSNSLYDCFICGSDQIWNLNITGYDLTYFLDFSSKKKIAYAASNGKNSFDEKDFNLVNDLLNKFDSISVREFGMEEYLKARITPSVNKVLDPVFLLDKEEWNKILPALKNKRYILIYVLHEESIYYVAKKMASLLNLDIICVHNSMRKPIKAIYKTDIGVEEFLNLIKCAEYFITDSFHGVSFGVIFRTNLKIVMKTVHSELNARLESLVKEFNLNDLIVSIDSSEDELTREVVFDERLINDSISKSKNVLLQMLGE